MARPVWRESAEARKWAIPVKTLATTQSLSLSMVITATMLICYRKLSARIFERPFRFCFRQPNCSASVKKARCRLKAYTAINLLAHLINFFFRGKYTDLGPFRAIRLSKLNQLNMVDTNFGWTIEMQIKASRQNYCEYSRKFRFPTAAELEKAKLAARSAARSKLALRSCTAFGAMHGNPLDKIKRFGPIYCQMTRTSSRSQSAATTKSIFACMRQSDNSLTYPGRWSLAIFRPDKYA